MNYEVNISLIKYYQEVYNIIMVKLTLDKTLKKLNISRYELAKRTGIQYQIIDNYYKNKVIRYDSYVLDKICCALDCDISDIIEYKSIY